MLDTRVLSIVSEYYGITNWDTSYKSRNIDIFVDNSLQNNPFAISYALQKPANSVTKDLNQKQLQRIAWDSILLNDVIGISDDKLVYKYLFKWYGECNAKNSGFAIRLIPMAHGFPNGVLENYDGM